MEKYIVRILNKEKITTDVLRIETEKPGKYEYQPGQATELAINKNGWHEEKRPFTFTSLPSEDHLEFTIKTYPSHQGVTNELLSLNAGDELIIHDVWGAISYKGEGLFIAGGAGITPFLSIFRQLKAERKIGGNKLIFANKKKQDIIQEQELKSYLGNSFINVLSEEKIPGYISGFVTEQLIKENMEAPNQLIYLCGPPPMMEIIQGYLKNLGAGGNSVVMEI